MAQASGRPAGMQGFTVLWLGQFVSLLGTGMTRFALTLWAWELTGSATALALIAFFTIGPLILFSPIAGALVDRWNRKLVMVVSDLMAGVATIGLFALVLTGQLQLWHLYAASAFAATFEAFQFPAFSAAITQMVDKQHYARTSALMGLAQSASGILAPIFAAALYGLIDLEGILLLDMVTFSFAVVTLLFIVVPPVKHSADGVASRGNLWSESLYGFRYILARRSLFGVQMIFFFGNMLLASVIVLIAPMVLARTGNDEVLLATVTSALGLGGVIGGLIMSAWGGFQRKINGVLLGFVLAGVFGPLLLGIGQNVVVWAAAAFGFSFFGPIINASNQAIWQSKVAPDVQGKVFAARRIFAQVAGPVSILIAGPLADQVFEPAMQSGGAWSGVFGWLVGVGPGAGIALMFVIFGLLSSVVGLAGYALPFIYHVETLVPDFDDGESEDIESPAETLAPA